MNIVISPEQVLKIQQNRDNMRRMIRDNTLAASPYNAAKEAMQAFCGLVDGLFGATPSALGEAEAPGRASSGKQPETAAAPVPKAVAKAVAKGGTGSGEPKSEGSGATETGNKG